ncbi:hypothetical protein [Chryseobacterium sp. 22458]|uniref:hypothetical protein n=1 Tax=Chryseobacterium sp. 22458 TaxID=3453921 RepID=UPI003F8538B7
MKKNTTELDRNYFLSYGHKFALILLLTAIGKLNTKFISVVTDKADLLQYTDVNNHLQLQLAGVSIHPSMSTINMANVLDNEKDNQYTQGCVDRIFNYKFPFIVNSKDFSPSFLNDIELLTVTYEWYSLHAIYNKYILTKFEKIKKFYINSCKLVDGFKFIIKIPDKLI